MALVVRNLPVAVAAFVMILMFVPESTRRRDDPLNWFGFLMLTVGLGSLQLLLNRGQRLDWFASPEIVVAAVLAAVGFYLFTVHTVTARRPFIDPAIFKDRNFSVGMTLVFFFVWMMFAALVLMPAFLQDIRGFPISEVGKVMGVRAAGTMFASVIAGWLVERSGARRIIVLGLLFIAAGEWQMSLFTTDVGMTFILVSAAIFGVGSGFAFVPLNVTSFWTLDPRHRGMATGLFALMTILGGSTGISVMITNLVRNAQVNRSILVEHVTPYNEVLRHAPLPPGWSLDDPAGLAAAAAEVQRQSHDDRLRQRLSPADGPHPDLRALRLFHAQAALRKDRLSPAGAPLNDASRTGSAVLSAEKEASDVGVLQELVSGAGDGQLAGDQHVPDIGEFQAFLGVLLDHDDGLALARAGGRRGSRRPCR